MTRLQELAHEAVNLLTPIVTAPGAPKRANLTSAIATAFRPYLEAAVTGAAPKAVRDTQDRRERQWLISLEFWRGQPGNIDTKVAESDGRRVSAAGEVLSYGGDIVLGLDAAADLIAEFAQAIGAPDDFSATALQRALALLRPTISRQAGHATMRRTSAEGRWHLICDVFREDAIPQ